MVYDRQGNCLRTWGKGDFAMRTHSMYVGPNGSIFAAARRRLRWTKK
jgi:hypothetical protein